MVLEALMLSQDPLTNYNYCNQYSNSYNLISESSFYDYTKIERQPSYEYDHAIFESDVNISNYCDNYSTSNNTWSSKINDDNIISTINNDVINNQYFSVEEAAPPPLPPGGVAEGGGGRRKRRRRSCKNREKVEQQRMTHIAVERNRRKQMNEYLALIRSLMPASYAQRGDQASIVGGAINYVKELEQHLENLEAQKRTKVEDIRSCSNQEQCEDASPIFGDLFTFPQYSNRRSTTTTSSIGSSSGRTKEEKMVMKGKVKTKAGGEIQVNMADNHANVRILVTNKQPKQLLKLVTAFQGLPLTILHLNVTSFDSSVLYSFSLKVEEGSQLKSMDDIADATNHILMQIQEEAHILL